MTILKVEYFEGLIRLLFTHMTICTLFGPTQFFFLFWHNIICSSQNDIVLTEFLKIQTTPSFFRISVSKKNRFYSLLHSQKPKQVKYQLKKLTSLHKNNGRETTTCSCIILPSMQFTSWILRIRRIRFWIM